MELDDLPRRSGSRPLTRPVNPHSQLSQNAPAHLQAKVRNHALSLPGVRPGKSNVSVPGATAFFLDRPPGIPQVPDLFGGEWGHIHPEDDGSLHLTVPTALAEQLIELGWAEYHNVVTQGLLPPVIIMLYGPRDDREVEVANTILDAAYAAAGGSPGPHPHGDR